MEASEKARELIDKFMPLVNDEYRREENGHLSVSIGAETRKKYAKHCASICVEEILATSASEYEHEDNFWRAVKENILSY